MIGWSSTIKIRTRSLIGSQASADKSFVRHEDRDDYYGWLWGEVLLIGLLGATLALFLAYPSLRDTYALPQARLVLDTAVTLAAAIVAVLAGVRFTVEGRRLDLLLCAGFAVRRDGDPRVLDRARARGRLAAPDRVLGRHRRPPARRAR